ncbi:unnamed protein product [Caenorhabditis brenneri]
MKVWIEWDDDPFLKARRNMSRNAWNSYNMMLLRYIQQKNLFIHHSLTKGERYQELCQICNCIADTLEMGKLPYSPYWRNLVISNINYLKSLDGSFIF